MKKSLKLGIFTFFTSCLVATASFSGEYAYRYLSTPSTVRLNNPVCVFVDDNRPKEEREGDPTGFWLYSVEKPDRIGAAQGLGIDICKLMEERGVTPIARVALSGEVAPESCIVVKVSLESWYGRVRSYSTMSEKVVGMLSTLPSRAEGNCRFKSVVLNSGKSYDLGVSSGVAEIPVSRKATAEKEANMASSVAADEALAEFFKMFEKQFSR